MLNYCLSNKQGNCLFTNETGSAGGYREGGFCNSIGCYSAQSVCQNYVPQYSYIVRCVGRAIRAFVSRLKLTPRAQSGTQAPTPVPPPTPAYYTCSQCAHTFGLTGSQSWWYGERTVD
jgi:hypothetical protein